MDFDTISTNNNETITTNKKADNKADLLTSLYNKIMGLSKAEGTKDPNKAEGTKNPSKSSNKRIKEEKSEEGEEFQIPSFNEHSSLIKYNYNVQELKLIAKAYKLKVTGNKSQLVSRIYPFLYLSHLAVRVQKVVRGFIQRKYIKTCGPAYKNRSLCTNQVDFLSMDELTNIPNHNFFSFKDENGFIYGFDLVSIYNLIKESKKESKKEVEGFGGEGAEHFIKNPFTTRPIDPKVMKDLITFVRLSKVLKLDICTEMVDASKELSFKKRIELKALSLFQKIDALGHYSKCGWFLVLDKRQLIKFVSELYDIWIFRASMSAETKQAICPPYGNPFTGVLSAENIDDLRELILVMLEKMVDSGIDKDSKCLGAYYVLGAITLVNYEAAIALPWLYQAVS